MKEIKSWLTTVFILIAIIIFLAIATGTVRLDAASAQIVALATSQQALPTDNATYTVVSAPQIPAEQIDQILKAYHSPFTGDGAYLIRMAQMYRVSSDYALAFWLYESHLGTDGEAVATHNPGNLRCLKHFACVDLDRGGYASFSSWEVGIRQWFLLIDVGYAQGKVTGALCTTVDQIIAHYAPSTDNNNEQAYIATVKSEVDRWRSGEVVLK